MEPHVSVFHDLGPLEQAGEGVAEHARAGWEICRCVCLAIEFLFSRQAALELRVPLCDGWMGAQEIAKRESIEPEVNHGRYKKRNHLRENQAANDDKAKRTSR